MKKKESFFDNRELSWLDFNTRVLEEAFSTDNPLLERLNFAAIYQSNLDEFLRVRVGKLLNLKKNQPKEKDLTGKYTPEELADAIWKTISVKEPERDSLFLELMSELRNQGIELATMESITKKEYDNLEQIFLTDLSAKLNPVIYQKGMDFPYLQHGVIYIAVQLSSKSSTKIGFFPTNLFNERLIALNNKENRFVLLEDLLLHFAHHIFKSYKIIDKTLIRITRSGDISVDTMDVIPDLDAKRSMEFMIRRREHLPAVRMQIADCFAPPAVELLRKKLHLKNNQVFYSKIPLDLSFVNQFRECKEAESLVFEKKIPQNSDMVNVQRHIIPQIKKHDILLSYPYESIRPFIRLLQESAADDRVLSIQITLYRVAKNSQIVEALCHAAENGKRVLVLVELRARFDEANNLKICQELQRAGCVVIHGIPNYKVHSKLCLITRKNAQGIEYITQIGTGNYNEKTAQFYTDLSLMTANDSIGKDAENFFLALSKGEFPENMSALLVAPIELRNSVISMIEEQITLAKKGCAAYIGAKINSLSDSLIIKKLVEAADNGAKVELLVRGLCCLNGSEHPNIQIRSVVGRYLEHSRIYLFGQGDQQKIYISSADYMSRNTKNRVEVAAPILEDATRNKLLHYWNTMMSDTEKARIQINGEYVICNSSDHPVIAQTQLMEEAISASLKREERKNAKLKKNDETSNT